MESTGDQDWGHIIQFTLAADAADRRREHRPPRRLLASCYTPDVLLLPWIGSTRGEIIREDRGGWISGPGLLPGRPGLDQVDGQAGRADVSQAGRRDTTGTTEYDERGDREQDGSYEGEHAP